MKMAIDSALSGRAVSLAWQALAEASDSAARLDTLQAIELAEGVEVRLRVAGPLQRGAALALDTLIQILLIVALSVVFSLSGLAIGGQAATGMILLSTFVIWWWYPVIFEAGRRGATPGKRAVGLRVVQVSGSPIGFGQAVLRNFLRFADGMPFMIGYGVAGFLPTFLFGLATILGTRRFQRLGDLAAGTVVVYERVPPEPAVPAPPPVEPVAPAATLRPEEVRALIAFRDRAGLWSPGRQQEIGDHLKELSGAGGAAGVTRLMAMAHWLQERR